MIVKWRTSKHDTTIDRVECDHATDCYVVVEGRRASRRPHADYAYHDTWRDARNHLRDRTTAALDRAERDHRAVLNLTPPEGES